MDLTIRPREAGETAKEFAYRVLRDRRIAGDQQDPGAGSNHPVEK